MNNSSNGLSATNVLSQIARLIESVTSNADVGTLTSSGLQQRPDRTNLEVNSHPLPSGYTPPTTSSRNTSRSAGASSSNSNSSSKCKRKTSGFVGRLRTWNKDVVCLPYSRDKTLSIPKGKQRGALSERGLIGKIRLMSNWNALQVKEEVTSVFSQVFSLNADQLLDYDYLCVMTGMKKLKRPSVSSSFSWSGQEVASLSGQGSLYIMANTPLPSKISIMGVDDDDDDDDCETELRVTNNGASEQSSIGCTVEEPQNVATVSGGGFNCSDPDNIFPETGFSSSDLENLQAMFPHTSTEVLEEALKSNLTIDFAIEELLSNSVESVGTSGNFEAAEYFGRQLTGDIYTLSVCRNNFWQGAFMFYKRGVDLERPFRVSFDENGIELGIDTGGPRREFFQLLADNMTSTYFGFFEGDIPNLLPAMKGPALRLGHFRIIGTMIAHSIVNGGIGFPYLCRPLFEYILNQNAESCLVFCKPEMVPHKETKDMIQEISTCTEENFPRLASRPDVLDYLINTGWTGVIAYKEKEQIVATAILHEVIWKRESAINQLLQGLKFLNVLDAIRKFPQHFLGKFVHTNIVLNRTVLLQYIRFNETSNELEKRAKEFFIEYIGEDVEIPCGDDKRLRRCTAVLQFITGQQSIAGGLPSTIEVGYIEDPDANYPTAGTCGLKFYLPTKHEMFNQFSADMDKALECEAYGFHCF